MTIAAGLGRDAIVLSSSNASKKYFTDSLLVLSSPRGWVMHFRYESRWVDDGLKKQLPMRDAPVGSGSQLSAVPVLVAYMFQERDPSQPATWKPVATYPLRYGTLIDAYRTGAADDIAHFYFEVGAYWVAGVQPAVQLLASGMHAASRNLPDHGQAHGESAAVALLKSVPTAHLTHQPDETDLNKRRQYYPIVCYLRGLRKRTSPRDAVIAPQFGRAGTSSNYELTELEEYLFDFSFYVPPTFGSPLTGSLVALDYDEKAFASTPKNRLAVESRYDEQSWLVVPAAADRGTVRELTFKTELKVPPKMPSGMDIDVVDLGFTIPVAIGQDRGRRLRYFGVDLLGDFFLAGGTISLAVAGSGAASTNPPTTPLGLTAATLVFLAVLGALLSIALKLFARLWKP